MESVFANWVDQDLAAATKAVEQLKGNAKEDSANALIAAWMMKEPAAALNWAVDNNQDQIRTAIRLAETRPDDVWKWANSVTNPMDRDRYLELLADSLARSMPEKMGAFVASLEPGDNQSYLAAEVAGSWAATDPAAAAQWAMEFPNERYRTRAVGYIAKAWSTNDPATAATWIQSLPVGPSRDTAGMEYVGQLSDKSPDQAAGMIQSMNECHPDAIRTIRGLDPLEAEKHGHRNPHAEAGLGREGVCPAVSADAMNALGHSQAQ